MSQQREPERSIGNNQPLLVLLPKWKRVDRIESLPGISNFH